MANKTKTDQCAVPKKWLITGGCGFIGTSLIAFLQERHPQVGIRVLDNLSVGTRDDLSAVCSYNEIDADRLALKKKIDEGLHRLEKETLISRSGDTYFFLTNEERDINREIKNVNLSGGEEAKLLGELIFDDVLRGQRKHRYSVNKMDFTFNRVCDMHPIGNRVEGGLVVSIITPLTDDYEMYKDAKCVMASNEENGQVLIHLDDMGSFVNGFGIFFTVNLIQVVSHEADSSCRTECGISFVDTPCRKIILGNPLFQSINTLNGIVTHIHINIQELKGNVLLCCLV